MKELVVVQFITMTFVTAILTQGQGLAMSLAKADIETTVFNDSAVFISMGYVTSVFTGSRVSYELS